MCVEEVGETRKSERGRASVSERDGTSRKKDDQMHKTVMYVRQVEEEQRAVTRSKQSSRQSSRFQEAK